MSEQREQLHDLVNLLSPAQVATVHSLLSVMVDPAAGTEGAIPIDDEPETEAERLAVAEADEALRRGDVRTLDEVLSACGLTKEDLQAVASRE